MQRSERIFQTVILWSRWLAAPFLVGLLCCLILLIYRFFADLFNLAITLPNTAWHDLVVGILDLIDIALVANLILIVIFSGYENFIGRIEPDDKPDWPAGLTDVDFGGLKQRLLGSIVAIAAIDALAWYLDLEKLSDTSKLRWVIAFPLVFAAAMLVLAVADWLTRRSDNGAP
jgi:uncharacterized protein (TIGR00645 family)